MFYFTGDIAIGIILAVCLGSNSAFCNRANKDVDLASGEVDVCAFSSFEHRHYIIFCDSWQGGLTWQRRPDPARSHIDGDQVRLDNRIMMWYSNTQEMSVMSPAISPLGLRRAFAAAPNRVEGESQSQEGRYAETA